MAASALCVRPADCLLGGKPFFGAHRGVRAAPAPRRPAPQKQQPQYVQVATTDSTSAPGPARPARGRANGRKRVRRSPLGAGSPSTDKRVMENVVILKRGDQLQAKVAAADKRAVKAVTVVATDQHSPQGEPVAAAKQSSSARTENAEPVAAADAQAEKAEQQHRGADATNATTEAKVAAAAPDRHVPQAKDAKNAAALKRSGGRGKKKPGAAPPVMYSGPPFAAAPEPRELPIPLLLLNGRGARLRPRDEELEVDAFGPCKV